MFFELSLPSAAPGSPPSVCAVASGAATIKTEFSVRYELLQPKDEGGDCSSDSDEDDDKHNDTPMPIDAKTYTMRQEFRDFKVLNIYRPSFRQPVTRLFVKT